MTNCEHKFVFKRAKQIRHKNRDGESVQYERFEFYFCEKCLEGKELKTDNKYVSFRDFEQPTWWDPDCPTTEVRR